MISLLDTNVLIRFLTADESPKYKTLYSFFQSLEQGQMRVELKLIVLFQVIFPVYVPAERDEFDVIFTSIF